MCQVWPRVAEVWPGCGRSTAGALCAAAELHTARGPARGQYAPASGCAAKATAVDAFRGPIRPSLIGCGRRVAEVWPMCGRSTAGAPCAAVRPSTGWRGDSGHCTSDSDQRGRKSDCTAVHGLARSGFVHRSAYVWPKCGRCVAAARQARCAPPLSSILSRAPPRTTTRRTAASAAKRTAACASTCSFVRPSDCVWPACGRSVACVWPEHLRRLLGNKWL